MDISKFLSKVMGIYLLVVSLAMFLNMPRFVECVTSLIYNTSLMFVVGFFTLILGVLMIVSHNIWQWNWRSMISVLAWLVFLKGASILLYPQIIQAMSMSLLEHITYAYLAAGLDFIIGLLLCYFGFSGPRSHRPL